MSMHMASAQTEPSVEQLQHLAQHPTWQRLTFLQRGWPEIQTADFYLSNNKKPTAEDELLKTLAAFESDENLKCKFPARYYWLSTQLDLAYLQQGLGRCTHIPKTIEKMSVLLIGGYLKNPASTFGHMLVRIDEIKDEHFLLSNSYNFGGQIPENERGLVYAINGVIGKYPAVFANSNYYRNEAVYSRLENRDIWEYQLNLTEEQKKLLTYHLDELTRFKFNYYFIKQNCAYRTAELLEFIDGVQLTKRITPWYSPEYVINEFIEISEENEVKLIDKIVFRPSDQTKLVEYFKDLPTHVRKQINQILISKKIDSLNAFSMEQQDQIFYFLMKYTEMKYRENIEDKEYLNFRQVLLKERISRPATLKTVEPQYITKKSPAAGPKPSKSGIRLGNELGLDFTLYQRDSLNEGTDLNMSFKILEAQYEHSKERNSFNIELLNVTKLVDLAYPLYGQQKLSWQLRTGIQSDTFDIRSSQHFAQIGFGGAHSFANLWMGYQLFALALHDQDQHADVKSISGLLFKNEQWSGEISYEHIVREDDTAQRFHATMRKNISKNLDTRLHLSKQTYLKPQVSVGLNYYW